MNDDLFSDGSERFPRWLIVAGGLLVIGLLAMTYGMMQMFDRGESVEIIHADGQVETSKVPEKMGKIKVDIGGAVEHPGLYEVGDSDRIADVIAQAGGLKDTAHAEYVNRQLNLAEVVKDGQKIYIPFRDEEVVTKSGIGDVKGVQNGGININTATISELDSLVGIGESRAQKIIDNRPYTSPEELVSKNVLSQAVFEKISQEIKVR